MTQFLVKGVTVFGGEVKCKLYCFSISHFCVQFTQWPDSITLCTGGSHTLQHRQWPHQVQVGYSGAKIMATLFWRKIKCSRNLIVSYFCAGATRKTRFRGVIHCQIFCIMLCMNLQYLTLTLQIYKVIFLVFSSPVLDMCFDIRFLL